ncbi:MAG: hypothetical protein K6A45_07575 [Lachnospiraceae bacterium]|nr:hypothetical protein [Lachnospiraceae bacterium]
MRKIIVSFLFVLAAISFTACSGNKMLGKYTLTSMKVDGEEKATSKIKKAFEKEEMFYGVLEVRDKGKATLRIQGEDEIELTWDEKKFIDDDDNEMKYKFEEDVLSITRNDDDSTTKMKFEKIENDKLDWFENEASEKELRKILGSLETGKYKLTGLTMKVGDQEIDYLELAKSIGMSDDDLGYLEIIDDKNAVLKSIDDEDGAKLTYDDKYFYSVGDDGEEKIPYKASGSKITFNYEEEEGSMTMVFEK